MCGIVRNSIYGYLLFLLFGCLRVCGSSNSTQNIFPDTLHFEPGPVIFATASTPGHCGGVSADVCLKELQTFLHIQSLHFTSEKSELVKLCQTAVGGYNCSTKLITTPNCLSSDEKALFSVFVSMAEYTYFMFCETGPDSQGYLRSALLENSECILKQKEALSCCAEESKVPDLPVMYILDQAHKSLAEKELAACCPLTIYLKCAQTVVESTCGDVAANLTIEYIRRAAGEGVQEVCQKMRNYPEPDREVCTSPEPVCAGCRVETFVHLIVFISLLFVMRMISD